VVTHSNAGLPRTARLLRPGEFSRVYDLRQSAASGPLVLYAAPNHLEAGGVRVGLSVSRRVGGAVIRNGWKRRLREAFRAVRSGLPPGNDFVIVVRGGPAPAGAEALRQTADAIAALAGRVVTRKGYATARPAPAAPRPKRRR
jgi:ribonuclease P protein component